jgi:hypothetical protein
VVIELCFIFNQRQAFNLQNIHFYSPSRKSPDFSKIMSDNSGWKCSWRDGRAVGGMEERMEGWKRGCRDGRAVGGVEELMEGWKSGWRNGREDGEI